MVPAGGATEATVMKLAELMEPGDTIIGGGIHTSRTTSAGRDAPGQGIHLRRRRTSGGVWESDRGYCMMVGGPDEAVKRLIPAWSRWLLARAMFERTPAARDGAEPRSRANLMRPSGRGHFVKMVSQRIEYGLMQAHAEGFRHLQARPTPRSAPEHRFIWI